MLTEDDDEDVLQRPEREPLEKMSYADKGRFLKIRNWLNIIFIIMALAGFYIYYKGDDQTAWTVFIVAVVIKGVECVLRVLH